MNNPDELREAEAQLERAGADLKVAETAERKKFLILVNGDEHEVEKKEISYERVVELYLGSGGEPSNQYLVKYTHGPGENPSGTLLPGKEVKVKDGMRFRVAGTGES